MRWHEEEDGGLNGNCVLALLCGTTAKPLPIAFFFYVKRRRLIDFATPPCKPVRKREKKRERRKRRKRRKKKKNKFRLASKERITGGANEKRRTMLGVIGTNCEDKD